VRVFKEKKKRPILRLKCRFRFIETDRFVKTGSGLTKRKQKELTKTGPAVFSRARLIDSNVAARLRDVKTPGTWVGASDGPRVTADGSELSFLYLQVRAAFARH
jgi:hypothetical protein